MEENINDKKEGEELTLDNIESLDPEGLTDEQKTFIEENKSELSEEQLEKFGLKEEEINSEDIEVEVRRKEIEKKKEEEEVNPEDEETIGKVVEKRVKPLEDEIEVNAFLQAKPEFSKYKSAILKYMSHEAYKNVPVHGIVAIVAAKDMQQLGAKKEREARKRVEDTKNLGNSVRKGGSGGIDWLNATKDDYEAQKAKVLGRV